MTTAGGETPGAGLGLAAFMDRYAGDEPAPVEELGPAGQTIADVLESPERAAALIHAAAWSRLIFSFNFGWALGLPETDGSDGPDGQRLLVGHAGGSRMSLLVLTERPPGGEPRRVQMDRYAREELVAGSITPPRMGRYYGLSLYAGGVVVPAETIDRAVDELTLDSEAPMTAVVSRAPEWTPTASAPGCPSPSLPVISSGGAASASAGLLYLRDPDWYVTTACHAVAPDATDVDVAGHPATVVARDPARDICVLRISGGGQLYGATRWIRRVSRRPPRLNWPASFDGVTSGPTKTWVRAIDPSVGMFGFPNTSHVYTDNDTAEGDSGAVLLDEDDEALGFAAYRTAYGQEPSMSVWVWAHQAVTSVGLEVA